MGGGNTKLYLSLLQRYLDDQTNALGHIRTQLTANDAATAERLAHTLKGVSGNIGAASVEAQAALLEKALREGLSPPAIEARLSETAQALQPLLKALEAWFAPSNAATQPPPSSSPHSSPLSTQPKDLQPQLHTLCKMLSEMDGDAQEFLETLTPALATLLPADTLKALHQHVAAFDFEEALGLLKAHASTETAPH